MNSEDLRSELENLHTASFAWARRCCGGDASVAEDVLQTAYLKVLSGKARFRNKATLKTWFFGVVRLTALEFYRKAKNDRVGRLALRNAELMESAPAQESDSRSMVVRDLMKRLPERQREVLHLVSLEELTVAEAAEVMGVTVGSARQHYHRAKEKVRTLFEKYERTGSI